MVIIDQYLGYMHQAAEISIDGYNLIHFIVLYYVGCRISDLKYDFKKAKWLLMVLLFMMSIFHAVKMIFFPISVIYSMRYNSPMVMLASITLFLWASSWKIKSKKINWIATSVLSVYIIHSSPFIYNLFFGFLKDFQSKHNAPLVALIIPLAMILLYAASILLDKCRIEICKPFVNVLSKIGEKLKFKLDKILDFYNT